MTMSTINLSSWFENIVNELLHLIGRDLVIAFDAPKMSLFDFERRMHCRGVTEYFGLGFHLIVSPFRFPQK